MHILMKRIIVSSLAVYLTLGLVACMSATSTDGGGPSRRVADQDIDEDDEDSSVLSVVYNGERYTIETSRFVIGSDPSADLVIDDESIAAKHAVVIRDAEGYRIQDLGGGLILHRMVIDNNSINDGDVFTLGEVQLEFTF